MPSSVPTPTPEPSAHVLDRVRDGDPAARDRLLGWVYDEGLSYFTYASQREQLLSPEEAADLAGDCVLEFNRVLSSVRNPVHYARRMFRNNLRRFLCRKRARLVREGDESRGSPAQSSYTEAPFDSMRSRRSSGMYRFDDEQRRMWRTARRRIEGADVDMQQIIRFRLAAEPLPYRVIGELLGASEPALRMKMTRFCRSVRREFARNEKRRAWRAPDRRPVGGAKRPTAER